METIAIFTFLIYVGVFIVSGLSNGIIGEYTTGEISGFYPTLVTPAGYAFSIWGLIYFFFAVYVIFQVLPKNQNHKLVKLLGPWPLLLGISLFLWQIVWAYQTRGQLAASVCIILFGLFCTAMIQHKLGKAVFCDYFTVRIGFSLCLGWLTVASLINIYAAFGLYPDNGISMQVIIGMSYFGIALLLPIAALVVYMTRDPAPTLTMGWGLIGIYVNQQKYMDLAIFALVTAIVILLMGAITLLVWIKNGRQSKKERVNENE